MILVTSPPACGKTTLAKKLAKSLDNAVYLDKDTLIPLSKKVFEVANEEYNRSSAFFETHIRDVEYDVILALGLEAIEYDSHVIINAPFSREIRDPEAISELWHRVQQRGGELLIIWIACSAETAHKRMLERNSDRDTWKLAHWDEYLKTTNFNAPNLPNLLIYKNDNDDEAEESFQSLIEQIQ